MTGINVGSAQEKLIDYDAENRPVKIKVKQSNGSYAATQYFYDGNGQRVKKISSSGSVTLYIGSLELRGTEKTTHYFGGGERIATRVSSTLYSLHQDHLGGLNVADDQTGAVRQKNTYFPFGETDVSEGNANLRHKFTDQEEDPETGIGLYYYGARYYYPKIGRFISPDSIVQAPEDPQSLNRYSYCRNNPLIYTDPSGHFFLIDDIIIGAILGSAIGAASSAATGGDIGMGALTGAIGGAFFGAAGGIIENSLASAAQAAGMTMQQAAAAGLGMSTAGQVGLHAAAGFASGGINAAITGGDVGLGMLTGGISGGAGRYLGSFLPDNIPAQFVGQTAIGGLLRGATSAAVSFRQVRVSRKKTSMQAKKLWRREELFHPVCELDRKSEEVSRIRKHSSVETTPLG